MEKRRGEMRGGRNGVGVVEMGSGWSNMAGWWSKMVIRVEGEESASQREG